MREKITATDGHVLTDGTVYGTVIYLAEGVDASRFHEITREEYETIFASEEVSE